MEIRLHSIGSIFTRKMTKIPLTLINNIAHTFNADDYMKLRIEHRIKGNLIGCLSSHPRNANFAGLPAIYSIYEMQLLLEKGLIVLIEKPELTIPVNDKQKQEYHRNVQRIQNEQNDFAKENKLETTKKYMSKIISGKKAKLLKQGINESEIDIMVTEQSILNEERNKIPDLEETNVLVQVPIQYPVTLDNVRIIPQSELKWNNSLKYRIFRDLWSQGRIYITEGDTFGCDFLVYPGDPIYYHASHIIHVIEDLSIQPKLLIGQVRLSVNVNKTCVYAYQDEQHLDRIIYQKLKWKSSLT